MAPIRKNHIRKYILMYHQLKKQIFSGEEGGYNQKNI